MAIDPSTARYRLGFDIGGTFTDFVLLDATTGGISLHKCLTTPEDPADGALDGIRSICAAAGISVGRCGRAAARHDAGHQFADRRARRAARPADDARLPRRARVRHRAALRHLRPVPALPRSAGAAASPDRDHRASRLRRPRAGAARRGGGAGRRHAAGRRRLLGDRGVLPAQLRQSGARAGGRPHPARGLPERVDQPVVRSGAGDPRVRAARHDLRQCLRAAADGSLHRPPAARARRAGLRRHACG